MRAKRLTGIALLLLLISVFTGCNNAEPKDWSEVVTLYVSSETGEYRPFGSPPGFGALEGLRIKEEKENYWYVVHLNSIEGFSYERGYEYSLKVEKTHLANPPADGSDIRYKLIEIASKVKVE